MGRELKSKEASSKRLDQAEDRLLKVKIVVHV
ncbi:hypothetical protein COLO4_23443 [Corchorus olitorius]|uniref:Uncharacterized protein n=1 Tax=Corchorus olitorius TaxID=93759 RepID=A0A1R3IGL5_9ROSI|nr:hypothetical protein COLO4_23443 [Corchorus olitorius]